MRSAIAMAALLALGLPAGAQTNPAPDGLLQRLERMVIPAAEFREARAADVLDFLCEASVVSDPDAHRSLGSVSPPRTIPVFELEDGSAPDLPPLDFSAQRLPLLQVIDLVCAGAGLQFAIGPAGPEFFLPDGRRLVRKEIPAPPPAGAGDERGDGGFAGPGEIAPAPPDGIDWEPFVRSYAAPPAERESILERMGFACSRHPGAFLALREPASLPVDARPMDYLQAERRVGDVLWTIRIYVGEDDRLGGLFIHPAPPF